MYRFFNCARKHLKALRLSIIHVLLVAHIINVAALGNTRFFNKLDHGNTEPRLFGEGVISTNDYERGGTFAPDGKSFYFSKRSPNAYFNAICVSYFKGG